MSDTTTGPAAPSSGLRHSALYRLHLRHHARMVPFAGFEMPLHYAGFGAIAEHNHTREAASLFDIGHMGVVEISGARAPEALESLLPAALGNLAPGRQRYSFFTLDSGGILDDVIVGNDSWEGSEPLWTMVVNASGRQADLEHLHRHLGPGVSAVLREDLSLVALQGPRSSEALAAAFGPELAGVGELGFMEAASAEILGVRARFSRSGYTGEDGFEVAIPAEAAEELAEVLLAQDQVRLAGLAARDSLRLEAGLCLYGSDLDTETTPVEAGLEWAIPRRRREEGGFPGYEVIARQLREGPARKRVGLAPTGRRPVRRGAVLSLEGREVGVVTSGGFGPSAGGPVSMGYVEASLAGEGSVLSALDPSRPRAKAEEVVVRALPFVAHRYRR